MSSIFSIPLRSPGQQLTNKEINSILLFLRNQYDARRITSSTFGTSFRDTVEEDGFINAYFNIDLEPYAIFTIADISAVATPYYPGKALVEGLAVVDPPNAGDPYPYFAPPDNYPYPEGLGNPPGERTLYLTNGINAVFVGTALDCDVVGTETPRQVRYSGSDPIIRSRMEYVPNYSTDAFTVVASNQGPFVAVSNPDTVQKLVWICGFLPEKVDTAWVRTTIDQRHADPRLSVYPTSGASNTFVVERGILAFIRVPGPQPSTFIPYSPRQLFIAFNPCGYIPQGTIARMSYDRGYYYLFDDCQPYQPSSSSVSSSSIPSSSISSSISSSVPSSSVPSSSVPSSSVPSSSESSSISSSVVSSSSSQISSSLSSSSISSISSSSDYCDFDINPDGCCDTPNGCRWIWHFVNPEFGGPGSWSFDPVNSTCAQLGLAICCSNPDRNGQGGPPSPDGTIEGQVANTYCLDPYKWP